MVGLLDKSLVHPRDVFADVITDRAAAVIFAHTYFGESVTTFVLSLMPMC